ncbi:MAG: type II toxin-antitoxin system RelE/ParE family toxin [Candidatus Bathyarchaeota archaeon]
MKDVEKLDNPVAQRILRKIDWFSRNFERLTLEPLSGEFKGTFKLRVGEWRVIYAVEGETTAIQFMGHRKEIYRV